MDTDDCLYILCRLHAVGLMACPTAFTAVRTISQARPMETEPKLHKTFLNK